MIGRVTCGAASKSPSPGLSAATVQVPAATAETEAPVTMQMVGVKLLKVVSPFRLAPLLVALTVPAGPPTTKAGGVPKVRVCALLA